MPYFDEFGAQDTSPEMMERMYELLRQKTPEERFRMVLARMQFTRTLKRAAAKWKAEHGRADRSAG